MAGENLLQEISRRVALERPTRSLIRLHLLLVLAGYVRLPNAL